MVPLARFQTICVLAGGILLGYLAASDRLNPFPQARAASGPRDAVRSENRLRLAAAPRQPVAPTA